MVKRKTPGASISALKSLLDGIAQALSSSNEQQQQPEEGMLSPPQEFHDCVMGEVPDHVKLYQYPCCLITHDLRIYRNRVVKEGTVAYVIEANGDKGILAIGRTVFGWTDLKKNTNFKPVGFVTFEGEA